MKRVNHKMKVRFKTSGIELTSSEKFGLWYSPVSQQLTAHLQNLIVTYGREKVKELVLLHFLELDDVGGLLDNNITSD